MICYQNGDKFYISFDEFQTKLTYGMICYLDNAAEKINRTAFQTKLTYGMICYCFCNF